MIVAVALSLVLFVSYRFAGETGPRDAFQPCRELQQGYKMTFEKGEPVCRPQEASEQ